jgi:DNA-binding NarL/FixJ family response regulator
LRFGGVAAGGDFGGGGMKVLIADDHPLIRAGVRRALESAGGFEVVGEAGSGAEVLSLIGRSAPEVVLLDLRMPGADDFGCLDRIAARYPELKVVVLSAYSDLERVQTAFKHGACGYVIKSIDMVDLASAIRQALDGMAYHALGFPALNDRSAAIDVGLTEREMTILDGVARGLSNQAIAKELWVTEQTVKFHLTNIYRKLAIGNRTEAAHWAFAHGLITETEPAGASAAN